MTVKLINQKEQYKSLAKTFKFLSKKEKNKEKKANYLVQSRMCVVICSLLESLIEIRIELQKKGSVKT